MSAFVKFFLLIFFVEQVVMAQQPDMDDFEGNVKLLYYGSTYKGVLQVFSQGQWNAVCYQRNGSIVTNKGAAAAACRQLKYTTYSKFDSARKLGFIEPEDDKLTSAISGIKCPEVKYPSTEGDIFLMRCDNDDQLIPKEDCEEIVGILCNWDNDDQPYNGQIRRLKESGSSRPYLLEINFENQWLPVCTKDMSNASADSACRQLGFTYSLPPSIPSNDKKMSWKIDISACNDSFPCFTDCISRSVGYTLVDHCDENQYEFLCEFNKRMDGIFSAGNKYICTYQDGTSKALVDAVVTMGVILGLIFAVAVGAVIFITIYIYRKKRCSTDHEYKPIGESSGDGQIQHHKRTKRSKHSGGLAQKESKA